MIDCSKTKNYFSEKERMIKKCGYVCKLNCGNCPLNWSKNGKDVSCEIFERFYPEQAISFIQKWSDENPERTFLTEFLKNYPNTLLRDNGTPKGVCLYELGLASLDNCEKGNGCVDCWNRSIPIEDGEADD